MKRIVVISIVLICIAYSQNIKMGDGRLSPRLLNYQGYLTDTLGNPININSLSMNLIIYDQETGGNALWTESQSPTVENGVFHVILGTETPIPDSIFTKGPNRWLEIQVGLTALIPRTRIVSSAYAVTSTYADTALYVKNSAPDNDWSRSGNKLYPYNVTDSVGIARTNPRYTLDVSGTICGGGNSTITGNSGFIGGGWNNAVNGNYSVIGCGYDNVAEGDYATIGGGRGNHTANGIGTIGGGQNNYAGAGWATVAGGTTDTSSANYSFTTGYSSVVLQGYDNSAAFNGTTATAAGQTRVGVLAKTSGTFTIDHPLDPEHKILNHYFVESPDMSNVYSGSVILDVNGKGVVSLPDYFDALNKNPRIQLTGVGSPDVVYVAEDVKGTRFVIGGKPGMKVYWTVLADRNDQSANITRVLMPVEQPKEGGLAGRSLDDDFLISTKAQLERMGKADGFNFRHASSLKRYEVMKEQTNK